MCIFSFFAQTCDIVSHFPEPVFSPSRIPFMPSCWFKFTVDIFGCLPPLFRGFMLFFQNAVTKKNTPPTCPRVNFHSVQAVNLSISVSAAEPVYHFIICHRN